MRRLAPLLALILGASTALAAPVDVLVEEEARRRYAEAVGADTTLTVTLTEDSIAEALLLSAFWMDPDTGQFLANAVTEAGAERRIRGYVIVTLPVAVPARKMMPGEIISQADLRVIEVPRIRLNSFSVTDPAHLVGKQVRSLLTPGRQIMAQAVQEPIVIRRGQNVSIRLVGERLELTAPGRALTDAHAGEEIKVVNSASNVTLRGIARANGSVEIIR
jgi:flagella basal body P-ring formation protein FlgA